MSISGLAALMKGAGVAAKTLQECGILPKVEIIEDPHEFLKSRGNPASDLAGDWLNRRMTDAKHRLQRDP